jgi:hypothetical protein
MTARRAARATKPGRTAKRRSALERLEPREAHTILQRLLAAHPELRPEAEQMARALLAQIDFESVAAEVERSLRCLSLDDLGERAGRHRGGYTPPTQAAWDLLQEAVDPFLASMKRQMELGLQAEALETCKGIILGLYRIRGLKGDEFLGWAPDFPGEAAAHAVWALTECSGPERTRAGAKVPVDETFIGEHVPDWRELVAQAQERD